MAVRRPSPKQRQALALVDTRLYAASDIPDIVGVEGGYSNEALFLMRLMDRGWVQLVLTTEGKEALES